MNTTLANVQRGWSWLTHAWPLLKKDLPLWVNMALIYVFLAVALKHIPFIGPLLLVLMTPIMLAGALLAANALQHLNQMSPAEYAIRAVDPSPPTNTGLAGVPQRLVHEFKRAFSQLFRIFTDEDRLMPVLIISTLTLGCVVMVQILAQLLKVGGPAFSAMLAGSVGPRIWFSVLVGLLIIAVLGLLILTSVIFSVPLALFKQEHPLAAIHKSFSACWQHWVPVAIFGLPFIAAYSIGDILFYQLSFPLDYLITLGMALLLVPVFFTGLYRSYRDLFG